MQNSLVTMHTDVVDVMLCFSDVSDIGCSVMWVLSSIPQSVWRLPMCIYWRDVKTNRDLCEKMCTPLRILGNHRWKAQINGLEINKTHSTTMRTRRFYGNMPQDIILHIWIAFLIVTAKIGSILHKYPQYSDYRFKYQDYDVGHANDRNRSVYKTSQNRS